MFIKRICRNKIFLNHILKTIKMSTDARLAAVPVVEIDEGVFKYILIKVYGKQDSEKFIVR